MRYPVKIKKEFDESGKLKIKARVDFFEIVKKVAQQMSKDYEINDAELEISLLLPKKYEMTRQKRRRKKLEKQLLDDVGVLADAESVAAVHYLITSRSDVVRYVTNVIDNINNDSVNTLGGLQRGVARSEVIGKNILADMRKLQRMNNEQKISSVTLASHFADWIRSCGWDCKTEHRIGSDRFDIAVFDKSGKMALIVEVKNYKRKDGQYKQTKQIEKYKKHEVPILFLPSVRRVRSTFKSFLKFANKGEMDNKFIFKPGRKNVMEVDDFDVEVKGELKKRIKKIERVKENVDKPISKWNSYDFLSFIKKKFKDAYGFNTFEIQSSKQLRNGAGGAGRIVAMTNTALIKKFRKQGLTKNDLAKYIAWVYEEKAMKIKFPVTMAFLCSNTLITEWFAKLSKNGNKAGKGKRARFKK